MKSTILIVAFLMMAGCSSKVKTVTVVEETKCPTLKVVEVDLNETIPTYAPKDIEVLPNKTDVKLSVNSLLKIQGIMKQLRLDRSILYKIYKFNIKQLKRYNKGFTSE